MRIIGICSALIGVFGGLIALGNHLIDGVILAAFLFIGGILLSWYGTFKSRTVTIERGIGDSRGWGTNQWNKPPKKKRRTKLMFAGVIAGILFIILLAVSFSPFVLKTSTGKLYFQSILNDLGGGGNFIMNQDFPNGEQKTTDLWSHPNSFLSPTLKQRIEISELTFSFYHKMTTSEGGRFSMKVMLLNPNTGIQTICTESVTANQYSRTTSYTITFNSNMPQLMQGEKLYIEITGSSWYWGSSDTPSCVTYKVVPQYEEIPVF